MICLNLAAQEVIQEIQGLVQDLNHAPLAKMIVTARSAERGFVRTALTNEKGRFVLSALPVGAYEIRVSREDHYFARTTAQVTVSSQLFLTFSLTDLTSTAVEVVGEITPLDDDRAAVSTTISPDTMKNLPVQNRNFMEYAKLAPNVQSVQRGNLGMIGQRAVSTNILIDGTQFVQPYFTGAVGAVENNAPYSMSIESIKEFEVMTAGAPAEFGGSAGGFINAITKSGTNERQSSLFLYDQPSSLRARDPLTGASPDGYSNRQFGFSSGGPIVKDRLFYFFSYEGQRASEPVPFKWGGTASPVVLNPLIPADAALLSRQKDYSVRSDSDVLFGRLDWNVNAENTLNLRINATRFTGSTGVGVATASSGVANYSYDATAAERARTLSTAVQWTWLPGSDWSNELRFSHVMDDLPRESVGSLPTVQIGNVGIYGSFPYGRAIHTERNEIFDALTYQIPGFKLRGGFDLNFTHVQESFTPFSNGAYTFASLAAYELGMWSYYGQTVGVNGLSADEAGKMNAHARDAALFIQADKELSPSFKVSFGLRWDKQTHPDFAIADFSAGAALYTAPGSNPLTGKIPSDSTVSPRSNFVWTPDDKTVIRGSLGLYVSRTPSVYDYEALVGNGRQLDLLIVPGGPGGPLPWGPGFNWDNPATLTSAVGISMPPTLYTFSPEFRNPRTTLTSLSGQRQVGDWTLGTNWIYAHTRNLERIMDENLGTPTLDANGRRIFPTTRPNLLWGPMYVFKSDLESKYIAGTLTAGYAPRESPWTFNASWTWSEDKDQDSNERTVLGYHGENTQRPQDEWGWSDRDRRNVVILSSSYLDKRWTGLQTGLVARYMTGTPYSAIKTNDINNDGQADNDYVLGTHRNHFRTPAILEFDLQFSKDWSPTPKSKLTASLSVFNVFNHHQKFERVRAIANAPDNAPTQLETVEEDASTPRSCQFGLRYTF